SADEALRLHVVDYLAATARQAIDNVPICSHPLGQAIPSTPRCPDQSFRGDPIVPFGMSLAESLFHALADPNVSFLLLNIGFIALIAWVFHPGFHVSLAVGVIAIAIALAILETLPVELVGFVLLLVSAVLFVLDVKARAHGVLTAGGIGTLILGGLLLFNPSV